MNAVSTYAAFGDVGAGGSAVRPPCANTLEIGSAYSANRKPPPPIALTRRKERRPIKLGFVGFGSLRVVAMGPPYTFPAKLLAVCAGGVSPFRAITAAR